MNVTGGTAPARPTPGTTATRPAAILRLPSLRPRSTAPRRCTPRTVVGPLAMPPQADQVTSAYPEEPNPNAADPPSQPPSAKLLRRPIESTAEVWSEKLAPRAPLRGATLLTTRVAPALRLCRTPTRP